MDHNFSPNQLGRVYRNKITSITVDRRTCTRQGMGLRHVHDIYSEDESGKKYKAEYLTEGPTQSYFVVGQTTCFKCTVIGRYGDEIEPCNTTEVQTGTSVQEMNRNLPIGNTTYSIAMFVAKDIACAKLKEEPGLSFEKLKDDMFELAEEVNNWLIAKRDGL